MPKLCFVNECSSTNDEILKFIPPDFPLMTGVFSLHQTSGRGQYGNNWYNKKDENIAYSLAVKNFDLAEDLLINFHTAIIIRRFIAKLTENETKIKWPNDIILNKKKISGILIEKKKIERQSYYIIGIGINVLQQDFEDLPKAGSILTQTKQQFDPKVIAQKLHHQLTENILLTQSIGAILNEFNENLFKKNEVSVFQIKDNRQNGIIKNIDQNGCIWIDLENDGLQKFHHKEIELLY